jgi:hypothetical protein
MPRLRSLLEKLITIAMLDSDRSVSLALPKRPRRIDLRQEAILVNSDGENIGITILDLSSGGFRMELSELLREGEEVTLRDRGRDMPAKVKWVLGDQAGAVFLQPLNREL